MKFIIAKLIEIIVSRLLQMQHKLPQSFFPLNMLCGTCKSFVIKIIKLLKEIVKKDLYTK